jgi:hypothetical protein
MAEEREVLKEHRGFDGQPESTPTEREKTGQLSCRIFTANAEQNPELMTRSGPSHFMLAAVA